MPKVKVVIIETQIVTGLCEKKSAIICVNPCFKSCKLIVYQTYDLILDNIIPFYVI